MFCIFLTVVGNQVGAMLLLSPFLNNWLSTSQKLFAQTQHISLFYSFSTIYHDLCKPQAWYSSSCSTLKVFSLSLLAAKVKKGKKTVYGQVNGCSLFFRAVAQFIDWLYSRLCWQLLNCAHLLCFALKPNKSPNRICWHSTQGTMSFSWLI